jgi:Zn-finger nucleic acid-binding protein
MRTVDKNGVHIDQCEGCRGIFLDRGELEQIAGAESAY